MTFAPSRRICDDRGRAAGDLLIKIPKVGLVVLDHGLDIGSVEGVAGEHLQLGFQCLV